MNKYKDIINLPHKQSAKRHHMPLIDRAAQFAPFAALTGYDDAIKETGRLTDERIELSDERLSRLNFKFQLLTDHLNNETEISIIYFKPDEYKIGGTYLTVAGKVKKVDTFERLITMQDGQKIPLDDIIDIIAATHE